MENLLSLDFNDSHEYDSYEDHAGNCDCECSGPDCMNDCDCANDCN